MAQMRDIMAIKAEYIDYQVRKEQSLGEMAKGHEYSPDTGYFITIHELHGTVGGAKIRAKAKGWSLVKVSKVKRSRKGM